MCGAYKDETAYRYMNKKKRYNSYCKACEKLYMRDYMRIYRERRNYER